MKNYKELIVWQKSMKAASEVYVLVKKLPKEELFGLSDQMRRCAVSIPSNIAEGQARTSAEFVRFIGFAQGSRAELETQLLIGVNVGYFSQNDVSSLLDLLEEINRMLSSLVKTIQ